MQKITHSFEEPYMQCVLFCTGKNDIAGNAPSTYTWKLLLIFQLKSMGTLSQGLQPSKSSEMTKEKCG